MWISRFPYIMYIFQNTVKNSETAFSFWAPMWAADFDEYVGDSYFY